MPKSGSSINKDTINTALSKVKNACFENMTSEGESMYDMFSDAQYGASESTVSARPGWSGIKAVTSHHIISLPDDIPSRWGPRLVDFYAFVAKSIAGLN